ncbi:MAG: hypothetical protein WDZ36_01085 [Balneolaceae bacterium]
MSLRRFESCSPHKEYTDIGRCECDAQKSLLAYGRLGVWEVLPERCSVGSNPAPPTKKIQISAGVNVMHERVYGCMEVTDPASLDIVE